MSFHVFQIISTGKKEGNQLEGEWGGKMGEEDEAEQRMKFIRML